MPPLQPLLAHQSPASPLAGEPAHGKQPQVRTAAQERTVTGVRISCMLCYTNQLRVMW
jgi:hypothetical protein